MTLSILIPSRGTTTTSFAVALKLLQIPFEKIQILTVEGADVAYARNKLVDRAIGDYVFFLDDDVFPPINTLPKLLSHKKDIIAGLYFAKQQPHFPQIFKESKKKGKYDAIWDVPENKLIEIDSCGAGCLLIKREIFEKLKQPYFQYIPAGENTPRKGEDYFFCEKARKAGFKIYCDTSIICRHRGTKYVGPEFWEISKQQIEKMKEQMGEKKFNKLKEQFYK